MFSAQLPDTVLTYLYISLCIFSTLFTILVFNGPSNFLPACKTIFKYALVAADTIPTILIASITLAVFLAAFSTFLTWFSMLSGWPWNDLNKSGFSLVDFLSQSDFSSHYLNIAILNTRIGDGLCTFVLLCSGSALSIALLVILVHERRQIAKDLRRKVAKRINLEKAIAAGRKTVEICTKQLADVEDSLSCLICVDRLTHPYTLAPCGHTFDLDCLQSWFRTAPPREDRARDGDQALLAGGLDPRGAVFALRRTKVCPLCHATVRGSPAPARALREVLGIAVEGDQEREKRNPWKGLFVDRVGAGRGPPMVVI